MALIKEEAKLGCVENKYSSFVHILALCSVIKRVCYVYYPDCGTKKLKKLFNQKISPRTDIESNYSVHILFVGRVVLLKKYFRLYSQSLCSSCI